MRPRTLVMFGAITFFAALGITAQICAQSTQLINASQTDPKAQARILDQYGKLPLCFEANHGQTDSKVKFLSRGRGYSLYLTGKEAVIALKKTAPRSPEVNGLPGRGLVEKQKAGAAQGTLVKMELAGANAAPRVLGAEELPGRANYFIGNDPAKWLTNVPTYAKVKYEGVYPGVDLVYYGNQGQLEYDFVVAPGVDPNEIRLKFGGSGKLRLDEKGDLLIGTGDEKVRFEKPVVYQEVRGERKPIEGSYVLASANRIGFQLGAYDHTLPLVIDPVLVYSSYLGGSGGDQGNGIAVDGSGNAYATGVTDSTDFPTVNTLQPSSGGSTYVAFVTKINPSGSALVYSTYLGGSDDDDGLAIAVDASGNAYVTGRTSSSNFPTTTGAFQATLGGIYNAFVTKINPSGSALVYSTYLGGSGGDGGQGIAVDGSGNAYVTGGTGSTNFPTANAVQSTLAGVNNAFVTKFNPSGSALVYSTYLGGSGDDQGYGINLDGSGNAYVIGYAESTNFPTTAGAFQTAIASIYDNAFVTKINPTGSALVYSTYLGGSGDDQGYSIAVDGSGNAYVTGYTSSTNFPTANALQSTLAGGNNAFITKINPTGSALVYSTYLGGNDSDGGNGIAVDASGNAYVTGITSSTNFPIINAVQSSYGAGFSDAFVTKLNPSGSALVYSTYLGGSPTADVGGGIAVDGWGNAYVTGYTGSTIFPTTAGSFQPTYAGEGDAFVTKIASENTLPTITAIPSPGPDSNGWYKTSVTVAMNATDTTGGSGVAQIQFSLSGAENAGLKAVAGHAASAMISTQGITTLTYVATDNAGNQETAKTLTVQIDRTPPVVAVTGVSNGAVYYYNRAPAAGCNTTDALSGVASRAALAVTGGNQFSYGNYTATCSGATDEAGNTTAPVSLRYTVNGPTELAGFVDRKTGPLNARVWQVIIGNTGPGTAYNAEITNLSLRQVAGAACTPYLVSKLPVTTNNIRPWSTATVSVTIDFAGCASNARFILNGQVLANNGTAVGPVVMGTELP
jgi:Beta-propeller repeat